MPTLGFAHSSLVQAMGRDAASTPPPFTPPPTSTYTWAAVGGAITTLPNNIDTEISTDGEMFQHKL